MNRTQLEELEDAVGLGGDGEVVYIGSQECYEPLVTNVLVKAEPDDETIVRLFRLHQEKVTWLCLDLIPTSK